MARLAKTLVAAVAHDLRAPLSSIKASSSTLADPDLSLSPQARQGLAKLIDVQANQVTALAAGVTSELGPALRGHALTVQIADNLLPVDVDTTLITRVLANLVHN